MLPDFFLYALEALSRGELHIPLTFDANGLPKKPIQNGWPALKRDTSILQDMPWAEAKGIGLVLGPASSNIAVLDIDDPGLAEYVLADWTLGKTVETIRHRAHVYLRETTPSHSAVLEAEYEGRRIRFELKAKGTQVACYPTPGYRLVCDLPPWEVPSIDVFFGQFCARYGIRQGKTQASAGYPKPWQERVPIGQRDQAAFVEAHKLREAGIPLEQALSLMRLRWEQAYEQGGQRWTEIEATIRSAYRRGVVTKKENHPRFLGGAPL